MHVQNKWYTLGGIVGNTKIKLEQKGLIIVVFFFFFLKIRNVCFFLSKKSF